MPVIAHRTLRRAEALQFSVRIVPCAGRRGWFVHGLHTHCVASSEF